MAEFMSVAPDHFQLPKAAPDDFFGRFREIISDPLNLLIARDPRAGSVRDNLVYLHNGHRVPVSGPHSYCGEFSNILIFNRGVHEPLEEFVFQELLKILPPSPTMLELGAYWGHYSMWLKQKRPEASVHLVEPLPENLQAGINNFALNNYTGEFVQAVVGTGRFCVDAYLQSKAIEKLDILHSDIQGYECQMLDGCETALRRKAIDYIVISTHSDGHHEQVHECLARHQYRVEVSADFESQSTSFDGLIFASSPLVEPLFHAFSPIGRVALAKTRPVEVVRLLMDTLDANSPPAPSSSILGRLGSLLRPGRA
jgi:hypothetical protein